MKKLNSTQRKILFFVMLALIIIILITGNKKEDNEATYLKPEECFYKEKGQHRFNDVKVLKVENGKCYDIEYTKEDGTKELCASCSFYDERGCEIHCGELAV